MGRSRNAAERLRDRKRIAELYLKGWLQEAIAEEVGVDQSTVSRDLKALQAQWEKDASRSMERRRAEQEQKYLNLYREAMAAWERSLQDAETQTTETGGKDGPKTTTRREGQSGNPALLAQALAALRAIREMYGVDAPAKFAPTDPTGTKEFDLFSKALKRAYGEAPAGENESNDNPNP